MSNIDYITANLFKPIRYNCDHSILSGGEDEFMPHFNYKGFQFVEVKSNRPIELNKESLTAYFMHSDIPVAGEIKSSNPTLIKYGKPQITVFIFIQFAWLPNRLSGQRENGWTGDARILQLKGLANFDGITIYEKWLADHRDEQQPNGVLPAIIPTSGWGYTWANGPDWTSTMHYPMDVGLFYGDSHLLTCSTKT
ncbi:MAG: family 78 glycoside hydrolase catalytic domain [Draconibacterium sp.]|nr:family 78 glycoside hydrolase catalytic domain [Draconibacterium sp.]